MLELARPVLSAFSRVMARAKFVVQTCLAFEWSVT